MSTAEDLLLISIHPESGKSWITISIADHVLGGAMLFDLVTAGRLDIEGDKRKAKVVVRDHAPVSDPVVQAAFEKVRNRGRQAPATAVLKLGKKARPRTYDALIAQGAVTARDTKLFGIFPRGHHDVVATARRDDLLTRIRAALLHDQSPDDETGPLIGIMGAADLVKHVVDKPDRKKAKARAKEISAGDGVSEAVRKAIESTQAAVAASMIAASAGGAVAGSS